MLSLVRCLHVCTYFVPHAHKGWDRAKPTWQSEFSNTSPRVKGLLAVGCAASTVNQDCRNSGRSLGRAEPQLEKA